MACANGCKQFRGRVGRGQSESSCFLLTSDKSVDKLSVLAESNNGFEIAERDLEQRGRGDLFGTAQVRRLALAQQDRQVHRDTLLHSSNDVNHDWQNRKILKINPGNWQSALLT